MSMFRTIRGREVTLAVERANFVECPAENYGSEFPNLLALAHPDQIIIKHLFDHEVITFFDQEMETFSFVLRVEDEDGRFFESIIATRLEHDVILKNYVFRVMSCHTVEVAQDFTPLDPEAEKILEKDTEIDLSKYAIPVPEFVLRRASEGDKFYLSVLTMEMPELTEDSGMQMLQQMVAQQMAHGQAPSSAVEEIEKVPVIRNYEATIIYSDEDGIDFECDKGGTFTVYYSEFHRQEEKFINKITGGEITVLKIPGN